MEWKDRVPTKANRKKITFEDDTLGTKYATIEYADEPSESGTALNRANLIKGLYNIQTGVIISKKVIDSGIYTPKSDKTIITDNDGYATVTLDFAPTMIICKYTGEGRNYNIYSGIDMWHVNENISGINSPFDKGYYDPNKSNAPIQSVTNNIVVFRSTYGIISSGNSNSGGQMLYFIAIREDIS